MQLALLETQAANGLKNPAFTRNKEIPLHRWVPWIAGFSAQFVEDCLERYLGDQCPQRCWVLDPFAGVGTTLVEAYFAGFNTAGFEINPYAALACKVKLAAPRISAKAVCAQLVAFDRFMHSRRNGSVQSVPRSAPPDGFSGRTELFSPKVQQKVLFALDFINGIPDRSVRDMFRLAFGSVMVSCSNYSYEPSLTRRTAVNKPEILDADVGRIISGRVRLMQEDIESIQQDVRAICPRPQARVLPASFFSALEKLKREKFIDLVVTSPPYLNNYHYPRNTRPQIHWLGLASTRGYRAAGEEESFGKFWQTVRAAPPVALSFRLPSLEEAISSIRSRNQERGPYGGPGWANYVATYFNDAFRFSSILARLLRPGALAVIVLGNSVIQGVEVRTDEFFAEAAKLWGFELEDRQVLRQKRTGNSIIQSSVRVDRAEQKTVLYESAIILRSPH